VFLSLSIIARRLGARLPSTRLLKLTSITTLAFGTVQATRLVTNIILARILSPELFGVMLIINTLRTGAELFTNVGIGENVVSSRNAEEPSFYNTAWTLQIVRGALLTVIFSLAAFPLARFYETPILAWAIPVYALAFLIGGTNSTGRYLLQKRLQLPRLSIFDVLVALASAFAHVVFALISPTLWALIWGGVFTSVVMAVGSYFLVPGMGHKVLIDRVYALQILSFGKWIFLSSVIFFFASNYDRLFVGKALPLAVVGVYGVARSLAEVLTTLVANIGGMIIFPSIAAANDTREDLRRRIRPLRLKAVCLLAAGVGAFALGSELIVQLLYDERYSGAGSILPVLCVGVWFSMLASLNEAVLLGIRQQGFAVLANGSKLACLIVALPLGIGWAGVAGAAWAVSAAEFGRFVLVAAGLRRHGTSFLAQDLGATFGVGLMIAASLWLLMPGTS
jgi:O-antigen/teichoic acid export membrane protein